MNGTKIEESVTVLGRGSSFRGELTAAGDVVIEGAMNGLLRTLQGKLTVGESASVQADIEAREVIISGRVEGNIRASERVELRAGARVLGDIFSRRFAIEPDASFRGRVDPSRGGEQTAADNDTQGGAVGADAAADRDSASGELFGSSSRGSGKLPAGLAAAARNLGSAGQPVGLHALTDEAEPSEPHPGELAH